MTAIHTLTPGPFAPADIHVHWQNTPPVFSADVADFLRQRWEHYTTQAAGQHRTLFDAPISRLLRTQVDAGQLHLHLGPASYSQFIVSCTRDHDWFQKNAPTQLVAGLGNTALLTTPTHAIFGLRSPRVATYPSRAHIFGGVLDVLDTPHLPATTAGLLAHLAHELHEELSLTPIDLAPAPTLLGLFQDPRLNQPELLWHWPLRISLDTLRARLLNHEEHDRLHLLPPAATFTPEEIAQQKALLTPLAFIAWQSWKNTGGG